jgi:hypothetical protein
MNRAQFITRTAACAALFQTGMARASASKRSLWVWQTPLAQVSVLVAFARHNRFDTILLSLPQADRSALTAGDTSVLQSLAALNQAGLQTYAVAGDPSWVKRSRSEPPATVSAILDGQKRYGVFAGIALDVEPHTLPEWKDEVQKPVLAANYIQLLNFVQTAAAKSNLAVLATVHPTYAKYSPPSLGGQTLLQEAARTVDATDLMAYRNSEETLRSFGGSAMEQLSTVGRSWWLGVSTHSNSPLGTSYATLPATTFFPSIDATAADLANRYGPSFQGISVEDYRNTVALLGGN